MHKALAHVKRIFHLGKDCYGNKSGILIISHFENYIVSSI